MLLRRIEMRVILPSHWRPNPGHTFHASPGCSFKENHIESAVEDFINYLDKSYPGVDFRMVKVGPGKFNFIYQEKPVEKSSVDAERQ